MNEEKDQLIDDFPNLYINMLGETIEILPDKEEVSNWNMISVTGPDRYSYARQICEVLAKADGRAEG